MPELPPARRARMVERYGIPVYDAGVLAAEREVADYFEAAAAVCSNYKAVSNWVMTEMMRALSEAGKEIGDGKISPQALGELIGLVDGQAINMPAAKKVFSSPV